MKINLKILGNDLGEYDLTRVEPYLKGLPRLIRAFAVGMTHPKVSPWMKLYALAGIIYFFSPLDIMPDFITGIGFVDDAIFALLIMQMFLRQLGPDLLSRILGGDPQEQVFFNVKNGVEAFRDTFGDIYEKVSERYTNLAEKYKDAAESLGSQREHAEDVAGE